MTFRGAKRVVARVRHLRRVRSRSRANDVLRVVIGAGILGLLAFVIDRLERTSRLAPARERLRRVYLASSGRLDNAWSLLGQVSPDDAMAVV